jgi:formylglycine-generating enzyme
VTQRPLLAQRRRFGKVASFLALLTLLAVVDHHARASGIGRPDGTHRCMARDDMVTIPAGFVLLGEDGDGRPGRRVAVPAFRIDRHEVTNHQFAAFVRATGYRTDAERAGEGAVFVSPPRLDGSSPAQWWRPIKGADWRHPNGPQSTIDSAMDNPVVQVTWNDANAYATWAGHELPSDQQWERAARGGQTGPHDPKSWAYDRQGHPIANVWQGVFPLHNTGEDGFAGLAPVGCFPPNDFGLVDMIGNAWEWTSEQGPGSTLFVRGGSYLCALNYCANFRPAGRQAAERDLPTSHIGFRTVASVR